MFVKNFSDRKRWLSGTIVKTASPVSLRVKLDDGRRRRYHQDQLRYRTVNEDTPEMSTVGVDDSIPITLPTQTSSENGQIAGSATASVPPEPTTSAQPSEQSDVRQSRRYPQRQRTQRQHYDPGLN